MLHARLRFRISCQISNQHPACTTRSCTVSLQELDIRAFRPRRDRLAFNLPESGTCLRSHFDVMPAERILCAHAHRARLAAEQLVMSMALLTPLKDHSLVLNITTRSCHEMTPFVIVHLD